MPNKIPNGAGILFICTDDNSCLLLLRSSIVSDPGTWGIPGGGIEKNETPAQAAKRETFEEIGSVPNNSRFIDKIVNRRLSWSYTIYIVDIPIKEKETWSNKIAINEEHTKYGWFNLGNLPKNLHPAIAIID